MAIFVTHSNTGRVMVIKRTVAQDFLKKTAQPAPLNNRIVIQIWLRIHQNISGFQTI
jgi:hypothetical protein